MTKNTILHRVVPVVGALALGGGIGAGVYAGLSGGSSGSTTTTTAAPATSTVQPASATTSSLTQIYKEATPGVVDITVTEAAAGSGFGFGRQSSQAEGTGFVFDSKGDIVTAAHVVDGASSIKVTFTTRPTPP